MKNSKNIIMILVVIIFVILIFVLAGESNPVSASIEGCYVARINNDVYTLNIQSQEKDTVSGTLEFKNFDKDSSKGTFVGTYQKEILSGKYSFSSEGMDSIMHVIFKKTGDTFVRGYGELNEKGTDFKNPEEIAFHTFSDLNVFKKEACPQN